MKRKKYCKCHNSYNHATSNFIVFRKSIQKAIKEGRFKLDDKGVAKMTVETDPFPMMGINMVSFSGAEKGKSGVKYFWVRKKKLF